MFCFFFSLEIPAEEIKNILESDMSEPGTHVLNHRFEAIHLRGTEDMNTQNVFDYFKGYAPASIEWINDYSCKFSFSFLHCSNSNLMKIIYQVMWCG